MYKIRVTGESDKHLTPPPQAPPPLAQHGSHTSSSGPVARRELRGNRLGRTGPRRRSWDEADHEETRTDALCPARPFLVVAADSLAKRDVFRLPDPFAVITVDGEQTNTTSAIKVRLRTLSPRSPELTCVLPPL